MMMTIALRFIPTLLEETDKIMKAQMARGADFESGNIMNRAKSLIPLLVPLFISAFRIAQDLAMAMEAAATEAKPQDPNERNETEEEGRRRRVSHAAFFGDGILQAQGVFGLLFLRPWN